ncbi:MAG: 50S ribosomal protein L3 [Candidatus Levyibacteriota bacterium]
MHAILGKKVQQTQKFLTDGTRVPVTVVEIAGNPVVAVKTMDKHGYNAVQLGYGIAKNPNKAKQGHAKGANVEKAPQFLQEVRFASDAAVDTLPKMGEIMTAEMVVKAGDIVKVSGVSKGKGFAGGVKRHHFKGGPRTHGQSDRERAPGSVGQTTTPGRVYKGKRMAGKMGYASVTVKNLTVIDVNGTTVFLKGLVPGSLGSLIKIAVIGEDKKFEGLYKEKVEEVAPEGVVEAPQVEPQVEEKAEEKTEAPKEALAEEVKAEVSPEEKKEEVKEPEKPAEAKEAIEEKKEEVKE